MKTKIEPPVWYSWGIFVWKTEELQAWYDTNGSFAFYEGRSYEPVVKNLGVGRHEIRFKEKTY